MALTVASRHYVPKAPVRLHKPLPLSLISILQNLSPKTPPAPKIPKAGPSSLFPLPSSLPIANAAKEKRRERRAPQFSILLLSLNSFLRKFPAQTPQKAKQENSPAPQFSILLFPPLHSQISIFRFCSHGFSNLFFPETFRSLRDLPLPFLST